VNTAGDNIRGAPAILARGANVYNGSNAPQGAGRPVENLIQTVSVVPKMNQLNLSGAIERRLRGYLAPQSPAVPQAGINR
jgi:hypothetical protein